MNKQPTLEHDQKKGQSRSKLHDLPAKKNLKGGSSAKSGASENGSPVIPRSLQEFLKRDSLPIKSQSRTSKLIIGAVIGLVVGLVVISVYLIILVRRNRGIYAASEFEDLVKAPVVLQVPQLQSGTVAYLLNDPEL